jgi:tripartite-type tricarboxylate transporter receptor subunit TctC
VPKNITLGLSTRPRRQWARAGAGVAAVVLASGLLAACSSDADSGDDDGSGQPAEAGEATYDGDQLVLVSSSEAGGGEDTLLQFLAPYVAEELGVPVTVEQQPGAEGLIMVKQLYASGDDNTRIAIMNGTTLLATALTQPETLGFDPLELRWVTRIAGSQRLGTVAPDGDYQSMEDLAAASGLRCPSGGLAGPNELDCALLSTGGFFDLEIIRGFDSVSTDGVLAMLQGDIDFVSGSSGSRAPAVQSGEEIGVFVLGIEPDPAVPDVPPLGDLEGLTQEQLDLLAAHERFATQLTSTLLAAPEIDEGQLAAIEAALVAAANNSDFQEEYAEVSANVIDPLSTEETEALAEQTYNDAPEEYYEIVREAYGVE